MLLAARGAIDRVKPTGNAHLVAPVEGKGYSLVTEGRGLLTLRAYCVFSKLRRDGGERTFHGAVRTTGDDPQTEAREEGALVLETALSDDAARRLRYVEVEDCTTNALVLSNSGPLRAP